MIVAPAGVKVHLAFGHTRDYLEALAALSRQYGHEDALFP